ncbi:MAG: flgA [Herminiimonas sp.]|jgi:flagella basal body P-ring formation protein FlgA|nr:flgA [Herminiimonas sp.]
MNPSIKISFVLLMLLARAALANDVDAPRQDHATLRRAVEQFLHVQAAGLPGQVDIAVGAIDPRLNLSACAAPEAFLPNGSRAWGKTTVGVRCIVPAPWTVYIPATVRVRADYIAAAVPLVQGQNIGPNDIAKIKGDLTALPPGVITDALQAVGHTVTRSVQLGAPLRQDALRSQQAVQQGQQVRLISAGPGFSVSAEGRALAGGSEGQVIQARTSTGQVVSGVAKTGGIVEVSY